MGEREIDRGPGFGSVPVRQRQWPSKIGINEFGNSFELALTKRSCCQRRFAFARLVGMSLRQTRSECSAQLVYVESGRWNGVTSDLGDPDSQLLQKRIGSRELWDDLNQFRVALTEIARQFL
ncbi:hypothetical protein ACFHWW_17725 [Ensifer sp. P24N7]|uniref:hypothetical protein n=1 Tax=Sinorhizobium sp. P24N7 TaxID=3348358 RepID=UPI0035F2456C